MTYLVSSKDREGIKRARTYQTFADAVEFATSFPGLARIQDLGSGQSRIFRNGLELRDEEAGSALREFEERTDSDP